MQLGQIVIDSADPTKLAGFYADLIGRPVADGGNQFMAQIDGDGAFPAIMFLAVPEPRSGKNRLHLDLVADDYQADTERAVGLGATEVGEFEEYGAAWVTLSDPEGNVFDIGRPH